MQRQSRISCSVGPVTAYGVSDRQQSALNVGLSRAVFVGHLRIGVAEFVSMIDCPSQRLTTINTALVGNEMSANFANASEFDLRSGA